MIVQTIFYFFSALLLFSASMVVVVRNPVYAALFLVLCFFLAAAIWLLLQAEFLAIALVLIYVGAVMVLFLFVVMMLDINLVISREGFVRYLSVGAVVAVVMAILMGLVVGSGYFMGEAYMQMPVISQDHSNTKELGLMLYTDYLYHFEVAGVILLVAIIAAISLSMNKAKVTRAKDPSDQVAVKKQDRLRIVKMEAVDKDS